MGYFGAYLGRIWGNVGIWWDKGIKSGFDRF